MQNCGLVRLQPREPSDREAGSHPIVDYNVIDVEIPIPFPVESATDADAPPDEVYRTPGV